MEQTPAFRTGFSLNRRHVLQGGSSLLLGLHATPLLAQTIRDADDLRPGQFVWHPERSATGPVAIIVSIPDQRVHVYRNGVRIGLSTCATGKPGHETPTGVFTILQKDKHHRSSTYGGAPMPNMLRLTWSGIALHAGNLPGYPASHGCVRLPMAFSEKLFTVTHVGMVVVLADQHSQPADVLHPGLVLNARAEHLFDNRAPGSLPGAYHEDAPGNCLSIVVSGYDRRAAVLENGEVIAEGSVSIQQPDRPIGSHAYILSRAADGSTLWHAFGHRTPTPADQTAFQRISAERGVLAAINDRIHIGTTLTTTDLPLHSDTRSGRDFVVMNTSES